MYSFTMLADVTNEHTGFYILCVLIALVLAMAFSAINDMGFGPISTSVVIMCVALLALGGYVSFTNAGFKAPANTPVTAKFLRYQPEEQKHSCGTYKQPSTCYTNKMYGVFEVPEGTVILEVSKNAPMPAHVTLYKN